MSVPLRMSETGHTWSGLPTLYLKLFSFGTITASDGWQPSRYAIPYKESERNADARVNGPLCRHGVAAAKTIEQGHPSPAAMFKEYRFGRRTRAYCIALPQSARRVNSVSRWSLSQPTEINQPPGRELHQHELKYEMFGPSKYHRLALDR